MAELEDVAPNFGRATDRWPSAATLGRTLATLRLEYRENGLGMVDCSKAFVECVCHTILQDFNRPLATSTPTTQELFVAAMAAVGYQNSRGANKLDKVLSLLNKLTEALTEMRNETGVISHGKDGFLDAVSVDHARAFVHVADALIGVLLSAYAGSEPNLMSTREPYGRFTHLNHRIDRAVGFGIRVQTDEESDRPLLVFLIENASADETLEFRVRPSELLYSMDRSAYVEMVRATEGLQIDASTAEESEQVVELVELPQHAALIAPPTIEVTPRYEGRLAGLKDGVIQLLVEEGLSPDKQAELIDDIADSLLATADENLGVDWERSERIKARLRVAARAVLRAMAADGVDSARTAARFVTWLGGQVADQTA